MRLFAWRRRGTGDAAPVLRARTRSQQLSELLRRLERQAEEGGEGPRVLLHGPPSGRSIETFHALGARVTVEGETVPQLPLGYPDRQFDLILAADVLDRLEDESARRLAAEWARVLTPRGRVLLLARQIGVSMPAFRVDVAPGGLLELTGSKRLAPRVFPRSNREIHKIVAPLAVQAIALRRDGLREISLRPPRDRVDSR